MLFSERKLILASRSPRRQQLLTEAGFTFEVQPANVSEMYHDNLKALSVAKYLAEKKAAHFNFLKKNEIVITADTTVVLADRVLGKPMNADEAAKMLKSLSGKSHEVVTGVCLKSRAKTVSFDDTTKVHFKLLTEKEIHYYIDKFEPFDKAGAYGIQEWIGMIGVEKIEGSYFNVMGLPIHRLYEELANF